MMNLRNRVIAISSVVILSFILLVSCDVYKRHKCPSYVLAYYNLKTIKASPLSEPTSNIIMIKCGNERPLQYYTLKSTGEDKEEYDRLCRKHNDLRYNQYHYFLPELPEHVNNYINRDFLSIEIISDTDYDEAHPAGTSLTDVVRFMSWSPYKYIDSGYKKYYYYDTASLSESFQSEMPKHFYVEGPYKEEYKGTCYPIDKMVKDLVPEDLILLGYDSMNPIAILKFEKLPHSEKEHKITVRMTSDEGNIFEDTTTIVFP